MDLNVLNSDPFSPPSTATTPLYLLNKKAPYGVGIKATVLVYLDSVPSKLEMLRIVLAGLVVSLAGAQAGNIAEELTAAGIYPYLFIICWFKLILSRIE